MQMKTTLFEMTRHLPSSVDLFISCASYESRCLSIPRHIGNLVIGRAIVFEAAEFSDDCAENKVLLRKMLKVTEEFELSISDPLKSVDAIVNSLSEVSGPLRSVLIDISTFPRESLLIILKYFKVFRNSFTDVYLAYNCAESMSNSWLSRGVRDVRPVLGYGGELVPSRPLHLVVLLGFELERVLAAIEYLEPSQISIGYGRPEQSINEKLAARNEQFVKEIGGLCETQIQNFHMSLSSIEQGYKDLSEYLSKFSNFNNVVLPLNTKLSTVACGLLAHDLEVLQICYVQMFEYNTEDYSVPSEDCYIFTI